ncbi:acetate--CoA ligase family protein [Patescibacteria group bacterium]
MNKQKNILTGLFEPKSIAIVGASEKEGKVGNVIAKNILNLGYEGKVFLVNPKHSEILGQKCYKTLNEIDEDVDLVIIVIPSKFVADVIEKAPIDIENFVVISAGFSETNNEGREREEALLRISEEKGLNILGPNCLGFISPKIKLNASFAGGMPKAGNIAFISQSGALAVAIMDLAKEEDISFSNIASIGNKMQLSETEIIEYLANDDNTKVIGMYLEGIKDGRKFIEVAEKVSQKKPIVILKAGKSEKAQKAISSHTGALAGSDQIMDVIFEKTGILRADNLENFVNLISLISKNDIPKNENVVIVTNAGGPGVLTTDEFKGKSISLVELDSSVKKDLKGFLPEESSVENPIDLLGDAQEDRYEKTLEVIDKIEVGSIICVLTPQDQTPVDKITKKIIEFNKKTDKIVMAIYIGGERISYSAKELEKNSISTFLFPMQAVGVLDEYYRWIKLSEKGIQIEKNPIDKKRVEQIMRIINNIRHEERNAALFSEAQDIVESYGIKTAKTRVLLPGELVGSDTDFPVVVKVDSATVLHKTERQGVMIGIKNQQELNGALEKMRSNFPEENIIIQPMLDIQTELIMGIKKDDIFGPIIVFGLGGIYTEIFKMVDFIVPSVDVDEIRIKLFESKIGFLFRKTRGKDPCDVDEVSRIIVGLSKLSTEISNIEEFDINPLLVYNDGRSAIAVDVKIIINKQ